LTWLISGKVVVSEGNVRFQTTRVVALSAAQARVRPPAGSRRSTAPRARGAAEPAGTGRFEMDNRAWRRLARRLVVGVVGAAAGCVDLSALSGLGDLRDAGRAVGPAVAFAGDAVQEDRVLDAVAEYDLRFERITPEPIASGAAAPGQRVRVWVSPESAARYRALGFAPASVARLAPGGIVVREVLDQIGRAHV
jgi:hypothetical protein